MIWAFAILSWTSPLTAETLRFALWHEVFSRDGPGELLRDLLRAEEDFEEMANLLTQVDPDILVLTKFDFDASGLALAAMLDLIGDHGLAHAKTLRSNEGLPSGHDLDGDGSIRGPKDAHGYGLFPGQGGLAIASRFPIAADDIRSFNELLWKDVEDTHIQVGDSGFDVQRLSSGGHWMVPIDVPVVEHTSQRLWLLVGHAVPPVFDGPEDRNGRRNLDELRLWARLLNDAYSSNSGDLAFLMANTNLDPDRGEGYRDAMRDFLSSGYFQDPLPGKATAIWDTPGPMRVSYLLPPKSVEVTDARLWPLIPDGTHHLITVDVSVSSVTEP